MENVYQPAIRSGREKISQPGHQGQVTWVKDENDRISEGGVDEDQVTVGVPLIVQDLENFARIHGAIV